MKYLLLFITTIVCAYSYTCVCSNTEKRLVVEVSFTDVCNQVGESAFLKNKSSRSTVAKVRERRFLEINSFLFFTVDKKKIRKLLSEGKMPKLLVSKFIESGNKLSSDILVFKKKNEKGVWIIIDNKKAKKFKAQRNKEAEVINITLESEFKETVFTKKLEGKQSSFLGCTVDPNPLLTLKWKVLFVAFTDALSKLKFRESNEFCSDVGKKHFLVNSSNRTINATLLFERLSPCNGTFTKNYIIPPLSEVFVLCTHTFGCPERARILSADFLD